MHDEIWKSVPEHRPLDAQVAEWAIEATAATDRPRLIDVGCGDARFAAGLAAAGAQVTGVDPSAVALDRARKAYPGLELARVNDDGTLPCEDGSFDAAVCINVLEHVADTQGLLSELRRVLVLRGRAVIAVAANGWLRTALGGPRAFDRAHDPLEPALRFYTAGTLGNLLAQFGFEQVEIKRASGSLLATARRA